MPDLEISNLPSLAEASVQATDPLPIADLSASETKKVTVKDLIEAGVALIDSASIPGAKVGTLGTNQVATAAIQDLAITTAKIANGAITATQITDATITGAKLVNDTITATQIAANAIGASELADNAVDTNAITNNAITNVKINNGEIVYAKLNISDGDIPGAKITGNSITSAQIGINAVGASELADNSVDTAAIIDTAITGAKIAADTIGSGNIAANAIGASELADNAVDTSAIASSSITTVKIAGNQVTADKLADDLPGTILATGAIGSTQIAANAITASELADNAVDAAAIFSNAVTEVKIASSAVTNAKIADNTITPAKLNTSNLDRSINVASGNLGINNSVTAATRSGITYNAQGLITGTVALVASDLPLATTSAVGGVSIGTGLSVTNAGSLSLSNSVTGATVSGITFNSQGMITAATALVAADLPTATTSAKGAVRITSGGGLTVSGSGELTTSTSGIASGTYTKITVNAKGVATAGTVLAASDIPSLAASKITSGSLDAARIGANTIDGTKLADSSVCKFTGATSTSGIVTFPNAEYKGQFFYDLTNDDLYVYDGSAFQPVTITSGEIIYAGNYRADTNKITSLSAAGTAQGFTVGSALSAASEANNRYYFVCDKSGTGTSPAPTVSINPPDMILSNGTGWEKLDISNFIAGQVASNIGVTASGGIQNTNVQSALEELDTEKLAKTGGEITGQLLIGNAGSLVFEGATADAFETTLAVVDPTTSDKTITFPDTTGTVITTGDTGTVTSAMLANGTIVNADINASAAIALSKLANVTAAQIIVGNGSNVPTAVAVTGDIGITNAGLTSISAGVIVNADVSSTAAIAGSKITTGTTSAVGVLQLTDSATSTSTSTAATPAAVKVAKDAADAAQTTANAALPTTGGTLTGNLILDNAKELRLSEADGDGANYTGLKAQAQSGDITLTLPAVAPTAGQVLRANTSTPTTLEWGTDTATDGTKMPLAGGTFTGDVTFTGDTANVVFDKSDSALEFADNAKLKLGTGGDLDIYHDGSQSVIKDTSGKIQIFSEDIEIYDADAGFYIDMVADGAVNLYYDGSKKLETTSYGNLSVGQVRVSSSNATTPAFSVGDSGTGFYNSGSNAIGYSANGTQKWNINSSGDLRLVDSVKATFGTGDDLQIYHDSNHSYISNTAGNLYITDDGYIELSSANGGEVYATFNKDDAVKLYYDNVKKFETASNGINVTGKVDLSGALYIADNQKAYFGAGPDLEIYHDGTGSFIDNNTGELQISNANSTLFLQPKQGENSVKLVPDGAVELYYDNSKKLNTYSGGIEVTGLKVLDSNKLKIGNAEDLQIYHDGSSSYLINGEGILYIKGDSIRIRSHSVNEMQISADVNGTVALAYDGVQKFETTSWGSKVTGNLEATGSLDVDSVTINGTTVLNSSRSLYNLGTLELADNIEARFGTGSDLKIVHDGSHSRIKDTGTGYLIINTDTGVLIKNGADDEGIAYFTPNGAVELMYDNVKKLETKAGGVGISGHTYQGDDEKAYFGASDDLQIYHNGLNSIIKNSTGWLVLGDGGSGTVIKGAANENAISCTANGAVELYHDNDLRLQTWSDGVNIHGDEGEDARLHLYADNGDNNADKWRLEADTSGNLNIGNYSTGSWVDALTLDGSTNATFAGDVTLTGSSYNAVWDKSQNRLEFADNAALMLGTGEDLLLYTDGSNSYIDQSGDGDLKIRSLGSAEKIQLLAAGDVLIKTASGSEDSVLCHSNGQVELFYDNSKKLETTSTGVKMTGTYLNTVSGSSSGGLHAQSNGCEAFVWAIQNAGNLINGSTAGHMGIRGTSGIDFSGNNGSSLEMSLASGNLTVHNGSVSDSKGNLRDIPVNAGSSAMTLSASDAGKVVATTSGGWVIPTGLSSGNTFTLLNDSGGNQTINATALTTLYNTADGTNIKASTLTLGARSMATVWMGSGTVGYIQATALTVS